MKFDYIYSNSKMLRKQASQPAIRTANSHHKRDLSGGGSIRSKQSAAAAMQDKNSYVFHFCDLKSQADEKRGEEEVRTNMLYLNRDFLQKLSIRSIACGRDHSLLLTGEGTIYAMGSNVCGKLGVGRSHEDLP